MIARVLDLAALLILFSLGWISYDFYKQGQAREAAVCCAISIVFLLILRFAFHADPDAWIEEEDE